MRTKRTPRPIITPRQPPRPYAWRITLIIQKMDLYINMGPNYMARYSGPKVDLTCLW